MNGHGQSDRPVVSEKRPNNAALAVTEGVEKRGLAKGNPQERNTFRTQSRADVERALERIRQSAKTKRKEPLTALYHHICNPAFLRTAFFALKKDAAPGIDGMTWDAYQEKLEERSLDLSEQAETGLHRAKAVPEYSYRRRAAVRGRWRHGAGGQTCPEGDRCGFECYLRNRLSPVLLRISAGAQPALVQRRR